NLIYRGQNLPKTLRHWPDPTSTFPTFLSYVRTIYDLSVGQEWDQLVGYLPNSFLKGSFFAGIAELTPFKPRVVEIIESERANFNEHTLAHEIGHNLGRHHTSSRGGNRIFTKCGDFDPSTDWP